MTLFKTRVETFQINKVCDRCKNGKMVGTGQRITQIYIRWENKCDNDYCRFVDYYDISYPITEYVCVGKPKRIKEI